MWRAGQLPVPAEQLPTGTIIIKEIKTPAHAAGLYARVSRSDQRKDLEAQLSRLVVYANNPRLTIVQAVSEVGSGLNGRRPKLIKLLANPKIQTIVVEHRDRLMRFGAEYVEAALTAQERKLLVMESSKVNDDLVQDMIEVLTSFCARLYGFGGLLADSSGACSACSVASRNPGKHTCVSVSPDAVCYLNSAWCDPARQSFPTTVWETLWHKMPHLRNG